MAWVVAAVKQQQGGKRWSPSGHTTHLIWPARSRLGQPFLREGNQHLQERVRALGDAAMHALHVRQFRQHVEIEAGRVATRRAGVHRVAREQKKSQQ